MTDIQRHLGTSDAIVLTVKPDIMLFSKKALASNRRIALAE